MMIKTINIVLSKLVTLVVWCAVALLAVVIFHALVIGGFTVYHLLQS